MDTYPKIETLYVRDPVTFGVQPDELRLPEFGLVSRWLITEKIDGTNIRVSLQPDGTVRFGGRTERAQIPVHLLNTLQDMFPAEKLQACFEQNDDGCWPEVVLFGEGYGVKIQRGGKYRKEGTSFRLFDVKVGQWWLNWDNIVDVAHKLGIATVPLIVPFMESDWSWLPTCQGELEDLFPNGSWVSILEREEKGVQPEGIVARTDPLLFDRRGNRVMWKLKFKDWK